MAVPAYAAAEAVKRIPRQLYFVHRKGVPSMGRCTTRLPRVAAPSSGRRQHHLPGCRRPERLSPAARAGRPEARRLMLRAACRETASVPR